MNSILKDNERIDDLQLKNLKIIQENDGFCFGIDSVLLSDFAKNIKNNAVVMDMGTGTGIIATLLCGKTNLSKVVGVEIQEEVFDMAKRSIALNKLEDKFEILNMDIKDLKKIYKTNTFDAIVVNPPYKINDTGLKNKNDKKTISRHEIFANLSDFIEMSKYLLKDKGELYLVHRPERLVDIISLMRENRIEPKIIRFVSSKVNKTPKLLLIKGVKNAKKFVKIEKNLIIYKDDGKYTDEIINIYKEK